MAAKKTRARPSYRLSAGEQRRRDDDADSYMEYIEAVTMPYCKWHAAMLVADSHTPHITVRVLSGRCSGTSPPSRYLPG